MKKILLLLAAGILAGIPAFLLNNNINNKSLFLFKGMPKIVQNNHQISKMTINEVLIIGDSKTPSRFKTPVKQSQDGSNDHMEWVCQPVRNLEQGTGRVKSCEWK